MESIPFLVAPLLSGTVNLAAAPPSAVKYHRFVHSFAISCVTILIAAIFRIQTNMDTAGIGIHISVVVGTQLIIAVLIIFGIHIYLGNTENKAKCAKLLAAQDAIEELLETNPNGIDSESLGALHAAQKELATANGFITALISIIYFMLILSLFPGLLGFLI